MAGPGRSPGLPEADGGVDGPCRRERLHSPAGGSHRPLREAAGRAGSRESRCSTRRRCPSPDPVWVSWSRATRDARPRSKAILTIRPALARRIYLPRRPFWVCTIPDRSQVLTHLGEIRPFRSIRHRRSGRSSRPSRVRRALGIRVLSETVSSPTLGAQIDEFLGRFPRAKWVQWEPFGRHNVREGSRLAFGEYVDPEVLAREGGRHSVARRRLPLYGQRRAHAFPCLRFPSATGRRPHATQSPLLG